MHSPRGPFKTAFLTISLAIGIPLILLMFGVLRHRQLQSKANPRWAQFAQISSPQQSPFEDVNETRRVTVRTASIRTEEQSSQSASETGPKVESEPVPQQDSAASLTGSASGRASMEIPVRPSERPTPAPERGQTSNDYDPDDHPTIVFRPAEEEDQSRVKQSIERHESQLKDMHQRLDQLASQQQEHQADDVQRETQFLGQLKQLSQSLADETAARESAILMLTQWVSETQQTTVSHQVAGDRPNAEASMESELPLPAGDSFDSPPEEAHDPQTEVPNSTAAESDPTPKPAHNAKEQIDHPESKPPESSPAKSIIDDESFDEPPMKAASPEHPDQPAIIEPEQPAHDDPPVLKPYVEPSVVPDAVPKKPTVADDGPIVPAGVPTAESVWIDRGTGAEGIDGFTMIARDADIRYFFHRLSEAAQVSILPSAGVEGRVSLNLREVPWERALKAIVKSRGYVCEREDGIITISTVDEVARLQQQNRSLVLKVYQPNYLPVAELNRLVEPLLSRDGRRSVTGTGAGEGTLRRVAHQDEISPREAVIVQDVADVHTQIDQILVEMDLPPLQVTIEAKILSIRLSGRSLQGIDLDQLPCQPRSATSLAEGGMKHASLSCNVPTFIRSIERLADTSVVTSQRIQVLNRHRAEMLIGDRVGFQCCPGGKIVGMEAGTRLVFRPSISADGNIRMEVHPERSTMSANNPHQPLLQTTAELTTAVLVRDGATIVIGGLIGEQAIETTRQVPLVGSIPVVGAPFRKKHESLQRTELIILVTPHIVTECEAVAEGAAIERATESRAAEFRDRQRGTSRHNLARAHYERARCYVKQGNLVKARQQVEASLQENKTDLNAIQLRNQIEQCLHQNVIR